MIRNEEDDDRLTAAMSGDSLARKAAHAIRTPLGVMAGALAQLQSRPLDETDVRLLELGQRASRQLARLADRLGLLSRLERDPDTASQSCDLVSIVTAAADDIAQTRVRRRVEVDTRGVSEAVGTWRIQADAALLRAAVAELVDNAVRLAQSRVTVALLREDDLVVAIANDGVSVADSERATSMAPDRSGLGIGLIIANEVARRHGGTIQHQAVDGPEGHRTVFSLHLPVSAGDRDNPTR